MFIARHCDSGESVSLAFGDVDHKFLGFLSGGDKFVRSNYHVNIAVFLIIVSQFDQVLVKYILFEAPGAKEVRGFGFHSFQQGAIFNILVSHKCHGVYG